MGLQNNLHSSPVALRKSRLLGSKLDANGDPQRLFIAEDRGPSRWVKATRAVPNVRPAISPIQGRRERADPERRSFIGGSHKRMVDVVVAGLALVLAAPIMLIVAAAIYLTMGGPVMFAQRRVGWGGKHFDCLKFRTMVKDSDAVLKHYLATNPEAAREWYATCKLADDPRVTSLGHLLRKSSLDELPQLINILRGDMSCVGPRPVVPTEIEKYGEHQDAYLASLPGLTGSWQCSGRSTLDYADRVALDVAYARNWSLALDFNIMLRTVPALLRFRQSA